jgi:ATP-dependent helicase/nuclease subunit A
MWTPKVDKQLRQMMETHIELLGVLETEGLIAFQSFPDHRVRPATFWRRRLAYATPRKMPEEDAVPLEDAVTDIHLLLLLLRRLESRDLGSLMAVLRLFARRFRRECSRVGAPSLDDLLLRARNLLRDHPAIRDEEARRSRVLLVDEFQDTDPLQYEIVFLLAAAASPEPGLDPWLSALEDGRLFIVGDPKQSIYRFRGADMAAFERAVRHVEAARGRRLTLEVNFRSRPRILDAVNRLFGTWVESTDPEIDPEYTAIHPHRPETGESPRVEVWSLEAPLEDRADALRGHEARLLARSILEWRDSGRFAYRDMAVLFRSLTKLAIYTTALRDAGIEYVVDGGKHFSERPEIVEAVALLRALANPADPVGALGVLRSAVGGATDAELAAFSRAGGVFSWRPNAANDEVLETFPAVQRTFQTLRDLETRTRRLPADRRILSLLTEGDFPVLMASYFEGAQRVANVRKLAHRAAELARDRKLSMDETVQALEQELLGEYNEGESPLADEAIDAVRILSIHAAKGLEFPLVVLPDLPRRGEHPEMDPAVKVALRDGAPRVAVRTGYKADMAMVEAGKVDTEHEKAEFKRLLYVATTRAKERLIVINSNRTQIGSWVKAMEEPWSYHVSEKTFPRREVLVEGMVAHRLIPADAAPVTAVRREAPDLVEPIRAFEAAAAAAAVEREPRHRTPSGDAHAAALDRNLDPGAPSAPPPELARIVGTAVHWALERWDFRDPGVLVAHLETAVGDRVQGGVPSDRILAEGRRVLEGFLASGLPAYLGGVEILARELPILFRDGAGRTVHGYIDLVYTAGGTVHVADYKTDAGSGEAAVEQYRNQVADYAEAVRRGWNLDGPPVCELLMLRTGGRIEVPPV